jgi:hypothetical protein
MAPSYLTSTLERGVCRVSRPDRFTSGERTSSTLWIGGWVDLRAGLDAVKRNILPCREQNPGRAVRSTPLYRLNNPDSCSLYYTIYYGANSISAHICLINFLAPYALRRVRSKRVAAPMLNYHAIKKYESMEV